jgi:hypothetical protein
MQQHNQTFYIMYANVACKIIAPGQWSKYFAKLYRQSAVVHYTTSRPKCKYIACITIICRNSKFVFCKFSTKPNPLLYKIFTSNDPLYLFPSVHQLIARILNIQFHLAGGFVLHSSAILIEGRILLFTGESGRGKSTIVDMIHHHKPQSFILSDNSTFIRQNGKNFVVYPSPYFEANRINTIQTVLPIKAPYTIGAVYFPFHATHNKVVKLTFREKILLIQKNSHIPYKPDVLFTASEKIKFSKTIFRFVRNTKIQKLEFVKNSSFMYHIL